MSDTLESAKAEMTALMLKFRTHRKRCQNPSCCRHCVVLIMRPHKVDDGRFCHHASRWFSRLLDLYLIADKLQGPARCTHDVPLDYKCPDCPVPRFGIYGYFRRFLNLSTRGTL